MPKVTILEKDLTSSGQQTNDNFVVLVPGVYSPEYWDEAVAQEPILISNVPTAGNSVNFDEFEKIMFAQTPADASGVNWETVKTYIKESYGFKVTEKLVKLGMTVLYGIIALDASKILEPGYNPLDVLKQKFFDQYADRSLYDLRFITTGGELDKTASEKAINCAAKRGDAIALIDLPKQYKYLPAEGDEFETLDLTKAEDIQKYLNEQLVIGSVQREFVSGGSSSEDASTYGAVFSPTFKYLVSSKYNEQAEAFIPEYATELGSFAYLSAFANHINQFPEWYAMAGSVRGVLPFTQVQPTVRFGMNDVNNYLTTRNGRKRACNPICEVRPYGNIVFGNRTLYATTSAQDVEKYGTGLRASHFLNIRQLCCTLKKVLYRASRRFMFEPNTDILWVNFCDAIRPTLDSMKTNQGIKGYSIERENTAVKGVLRAKIIIVPIEPVEDFDLTVELADSVEISE